MCAHASRTRRSNGSLAERPLLSWPLLDRRQRVSQLPALAMLIAWFAYTRLYFFLHPHGLTFDPSLFMYLTGKPDPTCGLTRTFAWTWRGDLGQAVRVYPLGPLAFALALAAVAYLVISALTGRQPVLALPRRAWSAAIAVALIALAANWIAKLVWLGM